MSEAKTVPVEPSILERHARIGALLAQAGLMTDEEFADVEAKLHHPDGATYANFNVQAVMALLNGFKAERTALAESKAKVWELGQEVTRRGNLLEDVVNELDLSDGAIAEHGPLGTSPAELVKLVLAQKDLQIRALKQGFVDAAESRLADLREGLEGLVNKWCGILPEGEGKPPTWFGNKLKPLITQSRPTVNSVDGGNAGENSGGET